jgi:GT2 family glycosyltransferase
MMMKGSSVTAVVLAYGAEPWLLACVRSVLASTGVQVEVLLVDNGCTSDAVQELSGWPRVTVLRPGSNLGFAGGVVLGAKGVASEFLAMVNSDAIVDEGALAALVAEASGEDVGIASACVVLGDRPDLVNSVGNPVHLLGFAWAGGFGDPVIAHPAATDVASATGACAVLRTSWWNTLGGFAEEYFAYYEDVELSWRTWQLGRSVRYVPGAVVRHHYEFSRSPLKRYLLERNRLIFILTTYERRTLLLLGPLLVAVELGLLLVSASGGWLRQKTSGWWWIVHHRGWVQARRRWVQSQRIVSDRDMVRLWSTRFDAGHEATPLGAAPVGALVTAYWAVARRFL